MNDFDKEIHEVLNKIGLDETDIEKIYEVNTNINFVLAEDIEDVIKYLKNYGLEDENIAEIAKKNPWILTESFERMRYLEKHYEEVGLTEFGELLQRHPIAMSINPAKVKKFIVNMTADGKSKEELKELLLTEYDKYLSLK